MMSPSLSRYLIYRIKLNTSNFIEPTCDTAPFTYFESNKCFFYLFFNVFIVETKMRTKSFRFIPINANIFIVKYC